MSRVEISNFQTRHRPVTLGDGDSLWLDRHGYLESENGATPVTLTGGRVVIENAGQIVGTQAHAVEGVLSAPFDIRIQNAGALVSSGAVIALSSDDGVSGIIRIANSGSIGRVGSGGGVDLSGVAADRVTLMNSGEVTSFHGRPAFAGSLGHDLVRNTGTILGDVVLGAGDDVLRDKGVIEGWVRGGDGDDRIAAGGGDNSIWGDAGRDLLSGGAGADSFFFDSLADSAPDRDGADVIRDYDRRGGDLIVLGGIDADATQDGDQAFRFIGAAAFSGAAGELRCELTRGGAVIYADVDGDAQSDFAVVVRGYLYSLADLHFVL